MTPDPLVEAIARTILRHQLGCNQPTALAVSCRKGRTTGTGCVCVRLARELNRRHQ